jgi:hypothetical protein
MITSRHIFRVIRARSVSAAALALAAAVAAGCNLQLSAGAEARDQWTRTYTLAQGGTFEIREPNGTIRIEAVDGDRVDVVAERIARAASDEAAKDLLSKMEIAEEISPARIALDGTQREGARILHGSRKVNYTVKLPRWAKVAVYTSNGIVDVTGLAGALRVEATNGSVQARGLESAAQVETTNGTARLEFAKVGDQGITCETTNGTIVVSVPKDTKASLSARVTNGSIRQENLPLEVIEQSQRRLDGTLNGGGAEIRLSATNGTIRIEGR